MRPAHCVLALALAVLPLAACASTDGPAPGGSSGPRPSAGPVELQRSGGIAGVRDVVTVGPDGGWRRTAKAGTPTSGTLSADERDRLARMAADPGLVAEATRTPPGTECADGFDYRLTAGGTTVGWQDCGSATEVPAAASRIAAFLLSSTG